MTAKCDKCGLPLSFKKIKSRKTGKMVWCPVNPDGTDHWDTCSAERVKLGIQKTHDFNNRIHHDPAPKGTKLYNWDSPPW